MRLELVTHCKATLTLPSWARLGGYTNVRWFDERGDVLNTVPEVNAAYDVKIGAPFVANDVFYTMWMPAQSTCNGLEQSYASELEQYCIVKARLLSTQPASLNEQSPATRVLARIAVESVEDPLWFAGTEAGEFGLADGLLDASMKWVVVARDRLLIDVSMQSDINFSYLLTADLTRVVLVIDESICQGFFWAGCAVPTPTALEHLTRSLTL
jgi:hypothetical protein